ncbi:MAG: PKD domain-containing protein [Saprospiraceae bacterium]|nr:PKD domain-containing protein [Saprospiraceae bacterium]MBP9210429.1 PKD domain-containing protein [Saprospiraceae bacterium]
MKKTLWMFVLLGASVQAQHLALRSLQAPVSVATRQNLETFELLQFDANRMLELIDGISGNVKSFRLATPQHRWDLQLFEYSLLSQKFLTRLASGKVADARTGTKAFRTFRGYINGDNQSRVTLSLSENFFKLMVDDGKERYFIEPLDAESLRSDVPGNQQFIAYRMSEIRPSGNLHCGVDSDVHQSVSKEITAATAVKPCNPCAIVRIALAADNFMFRKYKSSVAETENQMLSVLADVQTVFDDEFENEYIYEASGIYIADDPSKDPWYNINDINAMLDEFYAVAPTIFSGSNYNVATLWTSKFTSILGEVGTAYQATICNGDQPYNLCSDFVPGGGRHPFYLTLQAHMLGHNWSMVHDPFTGGTIMGPGPPNGVTLWSFLSKDALNGYVRDGNYLGNCLDICPNSSAPVPDFSSDVTYGCQPVTIKFKDLSFNTTRWKWTFPGGMPDTSILQNPIVVYKTPGIYPVILEAGNQRCEVVLTKTDYVEINDIPRADFDWGIQGREVFFINMSDRGQEYTWDFGDGEFSEEVSPFHEFYTDTTYEITLTARNDCGQNILKKKLTIVSIPTAEFEADTTGGCAPGTIRFNDRSTPNVRNWQWEFPGGIPSISTQRNPVVRYDLPGEYDVRLTVYSSRYNSAITKKAYITIDSIPVASFSQQINVGHVNFTNQSRFAKSHVWLFGDGAFSADANPEHDYTEGDYEVQYVAINGCGTDTMTTRISIGVKPTAAFMANKTSGCAGYEVQFDNQSLAGNQYEWFFPGGVPTSSTEASPAVRYPAKGKYDVQLIVRNAFYSDTLTRSDYIEVRSKPEADFSVQVTGFKAFFTDQTIDGNNFIWDFGNGKASFNRNPEIDYGVEGEFNVRLIVQNPCGTDTVFRKVAIYLVPKVNFSASTQRGCQPLEVQFSDKSSVDVVEWDWQFESGNPPTSADQNPVVVFDKKGRYTVKLTVRNTNGSNALTRVQYIDVRSPVECPENTKTPRYSYDDVIREYPWKNDPSSGSRAATSYAGMVFPNPAGEQLFVHCSQLGDGPWNISLLDATGRERLSVQTSNEIQELSTEDLGQGAYFLRCSNGSKLVTLKVIIAR